MLEFVRRNRLPLTSGSLLLASLLLLSVSLRSRPYRDPIARVLLDGLAPFQDGFTWMRSGTAGIWSGYINLVETRRQNEELRARIASLEADVVKLAELEQSNRRLGELLSMRDHIDGPSYAARVIGRDPLPWFHTLTIDRGERDGLRSGMAVLSPHGVIGQTVEVSRTAARVLLLTDHNSGIDAIVQRSRARGIVQGAGENECQMNYLARDADVVVGDRVITSGLDGIFPKGISIGEVVDVSRRHRGLLQAAVIQPTAPLDQVEEVLIAAPAAGESAPDTASDTIGEQDR
jgi:rod shape-determining protein MreC